MLVISSKRANAASAISLTIIIPTTEQRQRQSSMNWRLRLMALTQTSGYKVACAQRLRGSGMGAFRAIKLSV